MLSIILFHVEVTMLKIGRIWQHIITNSSKPVAVYANDLFLDQLM